MTIPKYAQAIAGLLVALALMVVPRPASAQECEVVTIPFDIARATQLDGTPLATGNRTPNVLRGEPGATYLIPLPTAPPPVFDQVRLHATNGQSRNDTVVTLYGQPFEVERDSNTDRDVAIVNGVDAQLPPLALTLGEAESRGFAVSSYDGYLEFIVCDVPPTEPPPTEPPPTEPPPTEPPPTEPPPTEPPPTEPPPTTPPPTEPPPTTPPPTEPPPTTPPPTEPPPTTPPPTEPPVCEPPATLACTGPTTVENAALIAGGLLLLAGLGLLLRARRP